MRTFRRLLVTALVCAAGCGQSRLATAQSDEDIAERVLGPQWKQLSQRAGIVFAGKVLSVPKTAHASEATPEIPVLITKMDRDVSVVEFAFRVDCPIAGVKSGQILTIREWVGAQSRHRPLHSGEHILLFLYPPSRLGLTSPVGGTMGLIELDARGQNVAPQALAGHVSTRLEGAERKLGATSSTQNGQPTTNRIARGAATTAIAVAQLERAIRAARGER